MCWCGTPAESNGIRYSSKRSASAERWRSPFCKFGQPERWGPSRRPAGGRLKPEIIVAIGGDRLPRLGSDVVTFEDIRGFLVAYSEHEQQTDIKNQGGGDRVLAGRRELAESAIQMVVADEFYNGKPCVDLSEEELMQGLKKTLLALIWRKRVMRVFPPDIPCAEYGCERVGR